MPAGTILTLGAIDYTIQTMLGFGSTTIVYHATYADSLSATHLHHVLIKELFPHHPQGGIARNEAGEVICNPSLKPLYDYYYQGFLAGTKVNLSLSADAPASISGNLNSFSANQTVYSVLPFHGGESLDTILQAPLSLERATQLLIEIIDALAVFHKAGFLYLDMSADNILVLPKQVFLIDYNSAMPLDVSQRIQPIYSVKAGYSAPEMWLQDARNIGIPTDIYSVCALYVHMLTGKVLTQAQLETFAFIQGLAPEIQEDTSVPSSAVYKVVQIITKGMQLLPRKRYQTLQVLRGELEEVLLRIHGGGISHSALWESGYYKSQQLPTYLPQLVRDVQGNTLTFETFAQKLCQGQHFLLYGRGGLGKSTYLSQLIHLFPRTYSPSQPAFCYISLRSYQLKRHLQDYIFHTILSQLEFGFLTSEKVYPHHIRMHFDRMLQQLAAKKERVVLLLDGLQEAGQHIQGLLQEIETLATYDNVSIVLTCRAGTNKSYALDNMTRLQLLPLEQSVVDGHLQRQNLAIPTQGSVKSLLQTPLMLSLYCQVAQRNGAPEHFVQDELIGQYLECQRQAVAKTYSTDVTLQEFSNYVLDFVLPQIGAELQKKKTSILTLEQTYQVTTACLRQLNQRTFVFTFPEYMGKSRMLPSSVQNSYQWYDYCVRELLIHQFRLLEQNENGDISLVQETFLPYLVQKHQTTRGQLLKQKRRSLLTRYLMAGVAFVLAVAIGIGVWHHTRPFPYTSQEIVFTQKTMDRLTIQLTDLHAQLNCQYIALNAASNPSVLDGDIAARETLATEINLQKNRLTPYQAISQLDTTWLIESSLDHPFPLTTMNALYQSPVVMAPIATTYLTHLGTLLAPGSGCDTVAESQPVVDVYKAYLDAYKTQIYLQLSYALWDLDDQYTQSLTYYIATELPLFNTYILDASFHYQDLADLERSLASNKNTLAACELALLTQGYPQLH